MATRGLCAGASAAIVAAMATASAGASLRPSPAHLIVGQPISLPAALYEAEPADSPTAVTPAEASDVVRAFWPLWQQALIDSNTRALTQLATPGTMLEGIVDVCVCALGTAPPPLNYLRLVVPAQASYPVFFLAEIQTTRFVDAANGLPVREPWLELQILTKASQQAPWQLSFDTGASGIGGSAAAFLPFDVTPQGYNPPPDRSAAVPAAQFLPLLASYWQSFKNTGHKPPGTVFVDDGYTSLTGAQLARHRQGSVYAGHRDTFRFTSDPASGQWQFGVSGGYPLVCGTVRDVETSTPVKGLLYQSPDEGNYGVPLPVGLYRSITTVGSHETCVYVRPTGLDAVGNNDYQSAVTGRFVKRGPIPKNRALADLETAYWVLATQLQQYETKRIACARSHAHPACSKLYAMRAELQFAGFERTVETDNLPARVKGATTRLIAGARTLNALFGRLATQPSSPQLDAKIRRGITTLDVRYLTLAYALSRG